GVLGVVLTPPRVRSLSESLPCVLVLFRVALVDEEPRNLLGLARADVGRLEDRTESALRRDRMFPNELSMGPHSATKVPRPGLVQRAVHYDVADLLRAQLLRIGRESQVGVNFPFGEESLGLRGGVDDPVDVRAWVDAHVRRHGCEEDVAGTAARRDGDRLA